jgi:hypothetical protein
MGCHPGRRNVRQYTDQALTASNSNASWRPGGARPHRGTGSPGTSSSSPVGVENSIAVLSRDDAPHLLGTWLCYPFRSAAPFGLRRLGRRTDTDKDSEIVPLRHPLRARERQIGRRPPSGRRDSQVGDRCRAARDGRDRWRIRRSAASAEFPAPTGSQRR